MHNRSRTRWVALIALVLVMGLISFSGLSKTVLKVAAFEGGYGVQWLKKAVSSFETLHPDVEIQLTTDPRIWEKVQPLFVAGTPPDVVAPGWKFDIWGAIAEGQVAPLEDYLNNTNASDKDVPWIDTFAPGTFSAATYNKHIWYVPMFPSYYGWWYDKTIWDKHGWTPPTTWDAAYALFAKMKAEGVAPIANQGIYPMYLTYPYLTEFIARIAGPHKYEACINLEPGSWTDPNVVKAVSFLKNLIDNYFQQGSLGMTHLQAQVMPLVGYAGLVACGSWYPKEQEQVWPEGHEIRAMPLPPFSDSPFPQNVYMKDHDSALLWLVPSASKHKELAVEFLKLLFSEQIQKYTVENTGNPTAYLGSSKWLPDDKFGRAVKSCTEYYNDAAYTVPKRETLEMWYPKVETALENSLSLMEDGKFSPEQVCAAIQAAADAVREDPNTLMHDFHLNLNTAQ